jgi:hypothetical protein
MNAGSWGKLLIILMLIGAIFSWRHQHDDRINFSGKNEFIQWLIERLMSQPLDAKGDISFRRIQGEVLGYQKRHPNMNG